MHKSLGRRLNPLVPFFLSPSLPHAQGFLAAAEGIEPPRVNLRLPSTVPSKSCPGLPWSGGKLHLVALLGISRLGPSNFSPRISFRRGIVLVVDSVVPTAVLGEYTPYGSPSCALRLVRVHSGGGASLWPDGFAGDVIRRSIAPPRGSVWEHIGNDGRWPLDGQGVAVM
jgi:hypothetical protein